VEPLIAERFSFICDIGAPLAELHTCWPIWRSIIFRFRGRPKRRKARG
jgi:hypothetical protein